MGSKSALISSSMNESNEHINQVSNSLFNKLGIVTLNSNQPNALSLIKRVELYLTRFPEIEYLIDMLASSIIYTSSSNTRKIQVTLNGEHKTVDKQIKTITPDSTSADSTSSHETEAPNVDIEQVVFNENVEKVDSYYKDMSIEIGNLFKKNNIKLSLYNLMFSILKFGCGIFYFDDTVKYDNVSFYGLDEVKFTTNDKDDSSGYSSYQVQQSVFDESGNSAFKSVEDDDHIKTLKSSSITVTRLEDDVKLKRANMFFIAEKGIFGKSVVDKVINYLKIIELLELSLLIERLSKSKTTHVWKLDLSKVEEEDVASTLMLYRNLIKSKSSMNFDEDTEQMSFDIVKNLVDSNLIVPTEDDNLKIETLKAEYKPLLDDIDYWWDKVYHTMGIPLHYRKSGGAKGAYQNTNMLSLHDNVYSMKIRHWQVILNNILTFWVEKWLTVNYKDLTIKFLNVNVPEFVPISERKETDLDKASKYVTMFTQLEQMLGMNIKDEFILNKLFPNDIISDIIEPMDENEVSEEEVMEDEGEETEEDILSLFESGTAGLQKLAKNSKMRKRKPYNIFSNVRTIKHFKVYSWNLNMNIDW